VAFLLDDCGVDGGAIDKEGITPLLAMFLRTAYNRPMRKAGKGEGESGPFQRILDRLLAGGGFQGLPWLTDCEKAALQARFDSDDKGAFRKAAQGGSLLALNVFMGPGYFSLLCNAEVFASSRVWPAPGADDPGVFRRTGVASAAVPAAALARRSTHATAGESDDDDGIDLYDDALDSPLDADYDGGYAHWEQFSEGRLVLTQQQRASIRALCRGLMARARHLEWRNSTFEYDHAAGKSVCPNPQETQPQWLARLKAEKARVNALLVQAGVPKPGKTNPCVRALLIRSHLGFEFTGDAAQLEAVLQYPCPTDECEDVDDKNRVTVRELLATSSGGMFSSGGLECKGCGEDVFPSGCGGRLEWGSYANHCTDCPGLGRCIGDRRNAHCYSCGGHPFVGSMGSFPCRCLKVRGNGARLCLSLMRSPVKRVL
jgi:hypothetical protein